MGYCYCFVARIVWFGGRVQADVDEPRVHFVTTIRSHPAGIIRSGSMPVDSRPALVVPRRTTLVTKRSLIKMSMSVTIGFMACFTPYFVISLIRVYSDYRYTLNTALGLSQALLLVHSALNPSLYIILYFRAVCITLIQLFRRVRKRCCQFSRRG